MNTVSIVMAAYNGEKYIGEQIESILKSDYKDYSLYICDDGSKDNTMSILKEYELKYPDRIQVSRNETNQGVTLNFLQAICNTASDYVMLCDQDDVWLPDKITDTLSKLKHLEGHYGKELPIAVFTDAEVVDGSLNKLHESFFRSGKLNPAKTDLAHLLMENKLIGCTVMINSALRNILKEHGLPNQAKLHDVWIALIAASFGKISYLNKATLLYRQHGGNVVGNRSFFSYFINRISSLKKQKAAVNILIRQAEEFLRLYKDVLTKDKLITIKRFADLNKVNFIVRRYRILHYGYLKTGFIRNLGLMFIV